MIKNKICSGRKRLNDNFGVSLHRSNGYSFLIALLLSANSYCQSQWDSASQAYFNADFDKAAQYYSQYIFSNETSAPAYYNLGLSYFYSEAFEEAAAAFKKSIALADNIDSQVTRDQFLKDAESKYNESYNQILKNPFTPKSSSKILKWHKKSPEYQSNTYGKDELSKMKRKLKADKIIFDKMNEDGVLLIRKKRTGKWGIVQGSGKSFQTVVPATYDSVTSPEYNAEFVFVYINNLIGIYLLGWTVGSDQAKESVSCIYNELKKTEINGCTFLAGMRNGNWGWLDWYTGREIGDFKYDSFADLPHPDCKWESEFYSMIGGCPGCVRLR